MKKFQIEIQKIKNSTDSVGRCDHYKDRELESRTNAGDHILKGTLQRTKTHRKWIHRL